MVTVIGLAIGGCDSSGGHRGSSTGAAASSTGASTEAPTAVDGYVEQIYSTGDFILNAGNVRFTIVMSPTTAVVNIRGRQVPRQFISVSGPAHVTGTVSGSKVVADTVLLPTRKDDP